MRAPIVPALVDELLLRGRWQQTCLSCSLRQAGHICVAAHDGHLGEHHRVRICLALPVSRCLLAEAWALGFSLAWLCAASALTALPACLRYDPYAPTNAEPAAAAAGENVYEKSKGLLAMARLSGGVEVDTDRGMWKGHGRLKGFHAPPR